MSVMATTPRATSSAVARLSSEGRLRPAKLSFAAFLDERGPLEGKATRASSTAIREERGRDRSTGASG